VSIYQGDSVVFVWKGPDTDHSATADDGSFDTGAGHGLNDTYGVSFTQVGTFTYHCKVHSFMHGKITVQPPPAGSTQTAPTLSGLKVSPTTFTRKTKVAFSVSSASSIRATLRRSKRVVKEVDFNATPGVNSKRLDFGRRLKAGRYKLSLLAIDPSSGLASKTVSKAVRVGHARASAATFDYPPITCGRQTIKGKRWVIKTHGPSCTTAINGVKGFMSRRTSPRFFKCKSYGGDIPAYCVGAVAKYKKRYFFASKA
jgi:hypothetical protein